MAATFPLLNLSPKLSQQVLGLLPFPELFDLSQCSKRSFNLVKTSFTSVNNLSVHIGSTSALSVISRDENGNLRITSWVFYNWRDFEIVDLEDPKPYKIDGMLLDFCKYPGRHDNLEFGCVSKTSTDEFIKFFEYTLDLLNPIIVKILRIHPHKSGYLEQLNSIEKLRNIEILMVDEGRTSHEEMHKILGSNAEHLSLSCKPRKNFTYDLPIRANSITVYISSWVTSQMLWNMDCKNARLYECTLTNEDLNSFLKHWLEGANTKLEHMSASAGPLFGITEPNPNWVAPDWNLLEMVKGIPTLPGAAKRPGVSRYSGRIGQARVLYENGVDLKRESDGMLATVLIMNDRNDIDTFLFEVWQVPDPNVVVG